MPAASTVFLWLSRHREFSEQYTRAREAQAEAVFEEIFAIADDGQNDTYLDEDGNECTDHEVIARSKLRVDTRKWALARMSPKKYGDRIAQEITNPDGSLAGRLSPAEKAAKLNAILAKRKAPPDDGSDLV